MDMLRSFKPKFQLISNVDYINISYMVDTGTEFVPYYEYTNIPHTDFISLDYEVLKAHLEQTGKPYRALHPVINEYSINNHLFSIQTHPVNTAHAFSAGLGVIKNKNLQLTSNYYLYDYFCESWMSQSEQEYYRLLKKEIYMLLTFGIKSDIVIQFYQSDSFDKFVPFLSLDINLGQKIQEVLAK